METISESSGNVFADLGFSAEESALLAMRAELMARLRETIVDRSIPVDLAIVPLSPNIR